MDAHGTSREDVGNRTMVDAGRASFLENSLIVPTAWVPGAKVQANKVTGRLQRLARDEFTRGPVHINGIEGFWGLAEVRLTKFKGLPRHTFHLHLKETEWRYNHRHANKYTYLLQYLRKNPLS